MTALFGQLIHEINPDITKVPPRNIQACQWDPGHDLPDMTGKVVVVTVSNGGAGIDSIQHLTERGAKVYALCHESKKSREACASINTFAMKGQVIHHLYNSGDLKSVQSSAKYVLQLESKVSETLKSTSFNLLIDSLLLLISDR